MTAHWLHIMPLQCLQKILGVHWQCNIPDIQVLTMAISVSIMEMLKCRRLWWLGHMAWMDDERLPKSILYGVLDEGICKIGRSKLRFKDLCKQDMKDYDLLEKIMGSYNTEQKGVEEGHK